MAFTFDNSGSGSGTSGDSPDFIGSYVAPQVVNPLLGLNVDSFVNRSFHLIAYVVSTGGNVLVTANPAITVGYADGQLLRVIGTHLTNTIQFNDGNGLALNGSCILGLNQSLNLQWVTGPNLWFETSRTL